MVVVGRGRFFWPAVAVVVVARGVLVVVSRRVVVVSRRVVVVSRRVVGGPGRVVGAPGPVVLVVSARFVVIVLVRVVLGRGALDLAVVVVTAPRLPVFRRRTTPVAPDLKPEVVVLVLVKRVVAGERARRRGKTFFGRLGRLVLVVWEGLSRLDRSRSVEVARNFGPWLVVAEAGTVIGAPVLARTVPAVVGGTASEVVVPPPPRWCRPSVRTAVVLWMVVVVVAGCRDFSWGPLWPRRVVVELRRPCPFRWVEAVPLARLVGGAVDGVEPAGAVPGIKTLTADVAGSVVVAGSTVVDVTESLVVPAAAGDAEPCVPRRS